MGLGCRLCRLATGVVGFGLVMLYPAPCAACFVGSASSLPPYGRCVRVAVVGGRVAVGVVLFAMPGLVLCWCVAPLLVRFAALVRAPCPLWGVLCRCVAAPIMGRVVVWPPSCRGVLSWCVAPLRVRLLCCCLSARVVVCGVVVPGLSCRHVRSLATGVIRFGLVVYVVVF